MPRRRFVPRFFFLACRLLMTGVIDAWADTYCNLPEADTAGSCILCSNQQRPYRHPEQCDQRPRPPTQSCRTPSAFRLKLHSLRIFPPSKVSGVASGRLYHTGDVGITEEADAPLSPMGLGRRRMTKTWAPQVSWGNGTDLGSVSGHLILECGKVYLGDKVASSVGFQLQRFEPPR